MIAYISGHSALRNFCLYCLTWFLFSFQTTGLGPYIPYLADRFSQPETQYYYLFTCRSFGGIAGSLVLLRLMHNQHSGINHHQTMIISTVSTIVCLGMFSMATTNTWQAVTFLAGSFFGACFKILPNVCLLMVNPAQQMEKWLMLAHGCFGIGGLIGPLLVHVTGLNFFLITSCLYFVLLPLYYVLASPENIERKIQNTQSDNSELEQKPQEVSQRTTFLLGIALMLTLGIEGNLAGWLPSFSILSGTDIKQSAHIYVTILWVCMTTARLTVANVPLSSTQKMEYCLYWLLATFLLVLILIYCGRVRQACWVACILGGLGTAPLYPLVFAVVNELGCKLASQQTATIVLFGQLAQGTVIAATGILMKQTSPIALFYWIILITLSLLLTSQVIVAQLKGNSQSRVSNDEQLREIF